MPERHRQETAVQRRRFSPDSRSERFGMEDFKMADNTNNFSNTVGALFKGMDSFITTKTVVGEAMTFEDGTIILPLVEVSFGVAAGAFSEDNAKKNNGGGGMGGKITPSAVLVIKDGTSKLVNVKNQDSVTKILDMVPDVINKFTKGKDKTEQEVEKTAAEAAARMGTDAE